MSKTISFTLPGFKDIRNSLSNSLNSVSKAIKPMTSEERQAHIMNSAKAKVESIQANDRSKANKAMANDIVVKAKAYAKLIKKGSVKSNTTEESE